MASQRRIFSYENGLLLLLGFAFGVAFFDRNAATVLVPMMEGELHLDNTRTGLLGSGLVITWAFGAYVFGRWSDASGVRKPFLVAFLVIFSVCSFISGLAPTFGVLLASRMVMGAVEGPLLPVCLALMTIESSEHRRGVNTGLMQNFFAALLGQSLAPLLLIPLAQHLGWRYAFYVAGIPGLLCAIGVLYWVREPIKVVPIHGGAGQAGAGPMGLMDMLKIRNIQVCCLIAVFMVAWLVMGWTYLPKFFTDSRHFTPIDMSYLMTVLGAAAALSGFVVPLISDRLGRRPVMIGFCLLAVLTPLAALYLHGPLVLMGALMFLGWLAAGCFPLFMGVIPGETVPSRYAASAMGLIICIGEVIGGSGINALAGRLADLSARPTVPVGIEAVCALIGGLLCLLLIETAPAKVHPAARSSVIAGNSSATAQSSAAAG
ncbi:MAG TPA: MFS transporter [Steroidobacteraceae bacterium]|nr:MFS transporter [Steroidobacteraceae bacterium]